MAKGVANNAAGAGGGPSFDAFFNNFAIVPEPTTFALLGFGLLGALAWRRRSA